MKVQTFLSSQELEHVKKESIKIFGRENVSGYLSTLVRKDMQASTSECEPPKYIKEVIKIPRAKKSVGNKKPLTTQELQAMADRLKG